MRVQSAAGSSLSTANLGGNPFRWLSPLLAAVLVVLLLVALMRWMIRIPEAPPAQQEVVDAVQVVRMEPEQQQAAAQALPAATPPPPPAAPPSLAAAQLPAIPAPSVSIAPTPVEVAVGGGASGLGLGQGLSGSGVFGGFASGGGSGGAGQGGYGQGQHFAGKELVPLSTARPQMPDWACKQNIKGWVEVVFTVMPNGRVRDVKIVDAQPRGVYEAAAIESISNWIYSEGKQPREVEQRVPMDPADCQYNWH